MSAIIGPLVNGFVNTIIRFMRTPAGKTVSALGAGVLIFAIVLSGTKYGLQYEIEISVYADAHAEANGWIFNSNDFDIKDVSAIYEIKDDGEIVAEGTWLWSGSLPAGENTTISESLDLPYLPEIGSRIDWKVILEWTEVFANGNTLKRSYTESGTYIVEL